MRERASKRVKSGSGMKEKKKKKKKSAGLLSNTLGKDGGGIARGKEWREGANGEWRWEVREGMPVARYYWWAGPGWLRSVGHKFTIVFANVIIRECFQGE